jgi:hypothetical protein
LEWPSKFTIIEYKAAPDIDTAKIPVKEIMIGKTLQCSVKE